MSRTPLMAIYSLSLGDPKNPAMEESYRRAIAVGRELGLDVVIAMPGDFNWSNGSLEATTLENGEWARKTYPLPDVVLERTNSKPRDVREVMLNHIHNIRTKLRVGTLSRFGGSKYELHEYFDSVPEVRGFLPPTALATSVEVVRDMLLRHHDVFLKPIRGFKSQHIYRLSIKGGQVRIHGERGSLRPQKGMGLVEFVRQLIQRRDFLVQRAIDRLTTSDGRVMDFRWTLHKDGQDEWVIVARSGKVASSEHVTTSLVEGRPTVYVSAEAALALSDRDAAWRKLAIENADNAMLTIARAIESHYGRTAEVGFDLGIDNEARTWLIEANPRPGKRIVRAVSEEAFDVSIRLNLEFALRVIREHTASAQLPVRPFL